MSRRLTLSLVAALAVVISSFAYGVPLAGAQADPEPSGTVKAGYGEADATWHVGAGAGVGSRSATASRSSQARRPFAMASLRRRLSVGAFMELEEV